MTETNGILLFAHNNSEINYGDLAVLCGKLAQKYLLVPVSLVTDRGTFDWIEKTNQNNCLDFFDKLIITDDDKAVTQYRRYYDGDLTYKKARFLNNFRSSAFVLTPYDNTLVIDTDMLIMNDNLSSIWDSNYDFMINRDSYDISSDRKLTEFNRLSDKSIDFYWATAFFFKKNNKNRIFFDLCSHIIDNYDYYRFMYNIDSDLIRNDFVFSIAIHILNGFSNTSRPQNLPIQIYHCLDKDELYDIRDDGSLVFLVGKKGYLGEYTLVKTRNLNVHIMNKFSILRNREKILRLTDV
jgi:hypothetical protein